MASSHAPARPYDVIVIGGGPSGSTAAHLVARSGARVLLLEKAVFPRFHVGESLLPCDVPLLERLGVDVLQRSESLTKMGADFFDESTGQYARYPFSDALAGTGDRAFQVDRASFDLALLERAQEAGVEVRQGCEVREVERAPDAVWVRAGSDRCRGRFLLDATGQDALLARRQRSKRAIKAFGLAAVFQRYEGLGAQAASELEADGHIRIFFLPDGWIWAIPLGAGQLSLGLVTREQGTSPRRLDAEIERSPMLSHWTRGAHPVGAPRRMGSFSFYNDRAFGERFASIGDAACFLDPVFSSGVSFAMLGAEHAADRLVEALGDGAEGRADLMRPHAAHMNEAYTVYATLIRSLYERRLLPGLFFSRDQDAELRRGLTSVLAGDLWRADNRFQQRLCASRRRRFEVHQPAQPAEGVASGAVQQKGDALFGRPDAVG